MKIQYKEYTLEPENTHYNLYKEREGKVMEKVDGKLVDTGNVQQVVETLGYGMSFEHCVEIIIKDILNTREEIVSLRQYINEYKELKTNLLEDVQH